MKKGFKIALLFFIIDCILFITTKITKFNSMDKIGIDLGSTESLSISFLIIMLYYLYIVRFKKQ